MMRLFSLPVLALGATALLFAPAARAQAKVAIINLQRALSESAEYKKASAELQAKYKKRQDDLEKAQRELQDIQTQLQASQGKLSASGEADLNARGQRRQRDVQRMTEDLQADVDRDRGDFIQRAGDRMTEVVKKVAEEKALDLVVDVSNAVYFKPALDITDLAIAAYDKAHPVK